MLSTNQRCKIKMNAWFFSLIIIVSIQLISTGLYAEESTLRLIYSGNHFGEIEPCG